MSKDTQTALTLLNDLDKAVREQDQRLIWVIRRTLESLPLEAVEDAVDIRPGT